MISALWTGISGLSTSQTALDNESNNIANVNTIGYKSSRVSFADQMYQDSIGKGSSVQNAEKQYVQGNLQLTGVEYDMALSGDGFFTVSSANSNGTSETYYTRAGNFRMGDNGTLQDSSGNEVQGWAISPIDAQNDVTSTNSNVTTFTNDYTLIAGNQIVQYPTSIDTYAAKMTDYTSSAKADSSDVFSGAGYKTQSTKIADIEALISNYNSALSDFAIEPDGLSTPSIAQISSIDFPSGTDSLLDSEGDQIYVYIDGNKISQNYIETTASTDYISSIDASGVTTDLDGNGTTSTEEYNILASRDATYKALADEISNITGLKATMVDSSLNDSTSVGDVYNGTIKIESIIPGESFTIGDVYEVSGTVTNPGTSTTETIAVQGTGEAAVESAMEALKDAVAGKQRDIYTSSDIFSDDTGTAISVDTDDTISFTIGTSTVTVTALASDDEASMMASLASAINTDANLGLEVEANIINGELVIESKTTGEEFSGEIVFTDDSSGTSYTKEKNAEYSINSGAGAEFMQIVTSLDQTTSQSSLQLTLDTLGISDSAFGEFSVDDSGVITIKQDGVDFAVGQVSIALFNNNIGLNPVGDNLLEATNTSGDPIYNTNNDKAAEIEGGTLELSTADLSESLVNLMVFQRAFEANAKSITTANEILTTLIQLKR